jgi:hypothetical protein
LKRHISVAAALSAAAISAVAVFGSVGASATPISSLPILTLTMTGNSITATPSVPSGAVNVVSITSGEKQSTPTLLKLAPGVTFQQAFAAVGSHHGDPNALQGLASIVASKGEPKGNGGFQTTLAPGSYVALDTTKNNPNQWPHTNFTVSSTSSGATLPTPSATVSAIEFGFKGPGTLHRGQTVRFQDSGYLVHMIVWIKAKNDKAAKTVVTLLKAGKDNKAANPKLVTGFGDFLATGSPGAIQQFPVNISKGTYVLACFMSTQDGREHTRLGMEKIIHVK